MSEENEQDEKPTSAESIRQKVAECYGKLGIEATPHMYAPEGITFDFCWGARVYIPDHPLRELYRVQIFDLDDGHCVFDSKVGAASWVQTTIHYYRPFFIQITDAKTGAMVFEHKMDLDGKTVLISFPVETVGDTLAWFKACEIFQEEHNCKLVVAMAPHMRALLEPANPKIRFINRGEMRNIRPYAFYQMGVNFDGEETTQPYDWRTAPLNWHAANVLGLDAQAQGDMHPSIHIADGGRPIEEPYVCISSMASGGCKLWLNPLGWDTVVNFLKENGYRVIDIDGSRMVGKGIAYQKIPAGAEDWTGNGDGKTLADRARLIKHADFFIGLGSGLSWLAWCCDVPVVLISGFSLPWCEFYTPYRIYNPYVCHGCFNDVHYKFDGHDCFWCPKHKNDEFHLTCSLSITPRQVINAIKRIPQFSKQVARMLEKKTLVPSKDKRDSTVSDASMDAPAMENGTSCEEFKIIDEKIEGESKSRDRGEEIKAFFDEKKSLEPGDGKAKALIDMLNHNHTTTEETL